MKTEQKKYFVILLLLTLLPMIFFVKYPINNELLVDSGDGRSIESSFFTLRGLFKGEFPMWNKYLENGIPTVASGSLINIPLLLLGWLPLHWYIYLLYCIHISCAAFFMFLYLFEIKCSWRAALAVAVMLLFSIHLGGLRKSHMGIICAVSLFPAVMNALQKHLNSKKFKYLVLASGVLAFAFSYTQTQHVIYMATASGIYFIISMLRNKENFNILVKRVIVFALLFFVFSAVTLLPTIELIREYNKNGSGKVSFDFFRSYSITPLTLIYMLFPRFYENIWGSDRFIRASELEIEYFIGVTALVFILFSIKTYLRKNSQMILSLGICFFVFLYMSIGNIPILRDFVYHMPVFGGFRCSARMLFVFLFFLYAIIGMGLTKLEENGDIKQLINFQLRFSIFILVLVSITIFILIVTMNIFNGQLPGQNIGKIIGLFKRRFLPTCIVLVLATLAYWFIDLASKKFHFIISGQNSYRAVTFITCIFVLVETIPFFIRTNSSSASISDEIELNKMLSENIDNGKIFDAFTAIDGGHRSIISQNTSISKGLPSINAYIPFNNPLLYRFISDEKKAQFNFSGLLTGSLNARENIIIQNDLLSMMGVKYVIDSSGILPDDGLVNTPNLSSGNRIPLIQDRSFVLSPWDNDLQGYSEAISIKPNTFYLIIFDYDSGSNKINYIDLYDTINDSLERKSLKPGKNHTEIVLYSGRPDLFAGNQLFRLFSFGDVNDVVNVEKLSLYELENDVRHYIPFFIDANNRIFENPNAKDILYFSNEVKGINDIEYLFEHRLSLKLDKISYILDAEDKKFNLQESTIKNINFRYNTITSLVESQNENFLNFSQCYFPGWRVYIDGKRAELKQVNALIMGVYIPPGTHTVKFSFVSMSFIWGLIITCLSVVTCVILLWVIPNLRHKQIS